MTNINAAFAIVYGRRWLTIVKRALTIQFPTIRPVKDAWVYRFDIGTNPAWEFHGPDDFYWYGKAANAYEARAKGWVAWMRDQGHDIDDEED